MVITPAIAGSPTCSLLPSPGRGGQCPPDGSQELQLVVALPPTCEQPRETMTYGPRGTLLSVGL
eukprot:COSAG01_NODE_18750_length_1055_cov_154.693515_2_plen_64_part_00